MTFTISLAPIDPEQLQTGLVNSQAGALVVFQGWVRNHNQGKMVTSLEYQVYPELAINEGLKILVEATEKFELHGAVACHRYGHLEIGEIAVWVGTTASHRQAAFAGTEYIIAQIKTRLPIWKKEHYRDYPAVWVNCLDHEHSLNSPP
ncbi:molybdenum cofactor biosynthesis protein MoaE [Synechococcus sp. PCC 6312]|uniref:molybdenum cofactor biosynthesis protein MoaE n=1 Tax=Synechococcus sp. (strain ATCC 27167 / PCC 6312) TaxID=195253 RepID=UPI00029EC8D3|nr:molybdenum cofactor biosynthesis protein MoaE [Synechococcus sp. PCC 6312]AFY60303.1 molybdopterin converting factor, large subunit [Synechococcus sp. PCC 6312]